MPSFAPFVGLVYDPAVVGPIASVTAPPYDVIDEPARSRYLDASRYSVAHVDLAGEGKGYDAAAAELRQWRTEGALKEVGPAWFGYEMRAGSGTLVRGVICGLLLEEWGDGVIPHEMVMDGPVQDRLQLLASVRVHPSAIYATVERAEPRFTQRLEEISATPAFREAVDEEGVRHRIWLIAPDEPIGGWLGQAPLLIADGHHRYATALLYRDGLRRGSGTAHGPWDWIPCLIVDEGTYAPKVLPYHRILTEDPRDAPESPRGTAPGGRPRTLTTKDLASPSHAIGSLAVETGLADLIHAIDDDVPSVGRIRAGGSYEVLLLAAEPPAVRALHETELRGVEPEILIYTPSAIEAEAAVTAGRAAIAYLLPPTSPARIRRVLRAGGRLPQKSTFFWPKPRTGMVMMPLDEEVIPTSQS